MLQVAYLMVALEGPLVFWLWVRHDFGFVTFLALYAPFTVLMQVELNRLREIIKTELPGYCDRCGYDLSGNASGICPECGTPIPLKPKELPSHGKVFLLSWYMRVAEPAIIILSVLSLIALIVLGLNVVRKLLFF